MLKNAAVVGALGVIGRYIVEKLAEEGDWQVVGYLGEINQTDRATDILPSICLMPAKRSENSLS